MEELFITKIKESPLTGAPNHNMTSQTIRCYVLYVTSYNTLLRAIRYFVQYAATQLRLFHIRLPLFNIAHLYFKKLRNLFKWNIIL